MLGERTASYTTTIIIVYTEGKKTIVHKGTAPGEATIGTNAPKDPGVGTCNTAGGCLKSHEDEPIAVCENVPVETEDCVAVKGVNVTAGTKTDHEASGVDNGTSTAIRSGIVAKPTDELEHPGQKN